jgi:hypothetical protein
MHPAPLLAFDIRQGRVGAAAAETASPHALAGRVQPALCFSLFSQRVPCRNDQPAIILREAVVRDAARAPSDLRPGIGDYPKHETGCNSRAAQHEFGLRKRNYWPKEGRRSDSVTGGSNRRAPAHQHQHQQRSRKTTLQIPSYMSSVWVREMGNACT